MSGDRIDGVPSTRFSGLRQIVRACAAALTAGLAACSPLTAFNALVPKDGGTARVVSGAAYGADPRQRLDVYAPRNTAAGARLPVVVWIYGGSWSSGDRGGYGFAARALAAKGFVVAVPDYRLVPRVRFPAFVEDGAAAVRWVRGHAGEVGGDPDRVVIAGHSAGAYIAAMLAMDDRWLGPDRASVKGWIGLAGPYDFLPLDGPVTQAAFGAWARPAETQPIRFAGAGDPPALLAYGDKDAVVRPDNSLRLAAALGKAGIPVDLRAYRGVTHVAILTALSRPFRRRAPVLDDMTVFVQRVTGSATRGAVPGGGQR